MQRTDLQLEGAPAAPHGFAQHFCAGALPLNAFLLRVDRAFGLTTIERDTLDGLFEPPQWLAAGVRIIREGEQSRSAIALLDGAACRLKQFRDGRRQMIAVLLPGDLCADPLAKGPTDHDVQALTRVRIAHLPAQGLQEAAETYPSIAWALARAVESERAILRAWIINLGYRAAYERLAHLLCEFAHRMRLRDLARPDGAFTFPMNQKDLSAALGPTSVRAEALIDIHAGLLRIRDPEKLQRLAGFDPRYLGD